MMHHQRHYRRRNNFAAAGQTASKSSNVSSAAGISTASRGKINKFTGSAKIVMRWKYTAIGSVIASSTTQEITNSSTKRIANLMHHGKIRHANHLFPARSIRSATIRIIRRYSANRGASLMSIATSGRSRVAV